ncbi:hypothetical protein BT93_J0438 [Corymbia citriodora subsp. variegata]|nr:hypothetical protein BT93_J0438 [Corymbia citriodora subsp. variegata]
MRLQRRGSEFTLQIREIEGILWSEGERERKGDAQVGLVVRRHELGVGHNVDGRNAVVMVCSGVGGGSRRRRQQKEMGRRIIKRKKFLTQKYQKMMCQHSSIIWSSLSRLGRPHKK